MDLSFSQAAFANYHPHHHLDHYHHHHHDPIQYRYDTHIHTSPSPFHPIHHQMPNFYESKQALTAWPSNHLANHSSYGSTSPPMSPALSPALPHHQHQYIRTQTSYSPSTCTEECADEGCAHNNMNMNGNRNDANDYYHQNPSLLLPNHLITPKSEMSDVNSDDNIINQHEYNQQHKTSNTNNSIDGTQTTVENTGTHIITTTTTTTNGVVTRVVKRRTTANKKERRRTISINDAFTRLREKIPNVPGDTKLSKIKTLRLATRYIFHLMEELDGKTNGEEFKADLGTHGRRSSSNNKEFMMAESVNASRSSSFPMTMVSSKQNRKARSRTGWPQDVWCQTLKHECE